MISSHLSLTLYNALTKYTSSCASSKVVALHNHFIMLTKIGPSKRFCISIESIKRKIFAPRNDLPVPGGPCENHDIIEKLEPINVKLLLYVYNIIMRYVHSIERHKASPFSYRSKK